MNFEPDIRSNLLLGLSGASRRVGYSSGGGAAFLTDALVFNPEMHTATNALRLVDAVLPVAAVPPATGLSRLPVTEAGRAAAKRLLGSSADSRLLVGLHASGGRQVKQWHLDRFADVATRLSREHGATLVLTGAIGDRSVVDAVKAALPPDVTVLDVAGSVELPVLAALLEHLRLFITADTGPMHLAASVGTPVVALFGPSDPNRYGPLDDQARVVTANLWCRPCNRVRRPPERCQGRVPDCLDFIGVDMVLQSARELLRQTR
jgi:ADP-heptose:LPS heptosyltransferase